MISYIEQALIFVKSMNNLGIIVNSINIDSSTSTLKATIILPASIASINMEIKNDM